MEIISRAEAKAKGLKRYFTGVPCKNGHIDERLVSGGKCCECGRERARRWRQANPEKNRESVRESSRKYCQAHPEKKRESVLKWAQANPEKKRERNRKWAQENPHKVAAKCAKRRAQKRQATTQWGNQGIEDFYLAADMASLYTGQPVHVDHIVPLAGRKVCGLHNEFNLQLLYGVENKRKGNRYHIE
jgi:hypothetical protein